MAYKILVTGGGTFLGDQIALALLGEGADITLLVREGIQSRLDNISQRVRIHTADVWNPASLIGRARGHEAVINTVGSMVEEPNTGLTFHRLNVVSSRNVANMCVRDGVEQLVLLSAIKAPWTSRQYVKSKREAEDSVRGQGLRISIIRSPIVYKRGEKRPLFYRFMTGFGRIPPMRWTAIANQTPLPVDVLARGAARISLDSASRKEVYYSKDLRRLNSPAELRGKQETLQVFDPEAEVLNAYQMLDENAPFGWSPSDSSDR